MSKKTTVSLRVSYLCKVCSQLFKSVEKYCAHKIEYHYLEFTKNASFVFEESFLEPADENENSNSNGSNFGYEAPAPAPAETANLSKLLKDRDDAVKRKPPKLKPKPKQQSPAPNNIIIPKTVNSVNNQNPLINSPNPVSMLALTYGDGQSHSELKTEWMENTNGPETETDYETYDQELPEENPSCSTNLVYMPQTNSGYSINYYDETEASLGSEDEDRDADADLSHGQKSRLYHDPLEYGPPSSEISSSQAGTAHHHQEFYTQNNFESDNNEDDNDSDIICLDDDDPPTPTPTKAKLATSMNSTRKTFSAVKNNKAFPSSPKKPQCQFCGKQFVSKVQLGMHVAKCHLYSKVKEKRSVVAAAVDVETETGSGSGGKRSPKTLSGTGNDQMLKCYLCPAIIKSCNLKRHLKAHKICVGDPNKKFVCSICGFGFRINSQLQEHAKSHTNERPFSCPSPDCESVFKYRRNLRQHIRTFHDDLIEMLQ